MQKAQRSAASSSSDPRSPPIPGAFTACTASITGRVVTGYSDFGAGPHTREAGDLGAEGLILIDGADSPVPGVPVLVVANEVSGTTTLFRVDRG